MGSYWCAWLAGEALATLVVNKLRGIVNVCAIKAPGFGERRKALLQDIAIVTGAEFIAKDLGMKVESASLEQLGVARKVSFASFCCGLDMLSDVVFAPHGISRMHTCGK